MDNWPLIECVPLNTSHIKKGQVFASGPFYVRRVFGNDTILLSELWGLARVSPTFGLGEIVPSRATWDVHGILYQDCLSLATSEIVSLEERHGLVFCTIRTETTAALGSRLLLRAVDEVLLSRYCRKPFFKEPVPRYVEPFLLKNPLYDNERIVPADSRAVRLGTEKEDDLYANDSYAKACGFEHALPEFVTYMDWAYHAVQESRWFLNGGPITIQLTKVLPLYRGETVRVITHREGEEELQVLFINKDGAVRVTAVAEPLGCAHL